VQRERRSVYCTASFSVCSLRGAKFPIIYPTFGSTTKLQHIPRKLLKQEVGDLILFSVNPGPHRRISHSNICEVDEKRLRELGPATDFNRVGSVEIYFYSPENRSV